MCFVQPPFHDDKGCVLTERKIKIDVTDPLGLLGLNDANLQIVENRFDSAITVRGDTVTVRGNQPEVDQVEKVFKQVCFRPPQTQADSNAIENIATLFETGGYRMKSVFAEVAVHCMGQ